MKRERGAALLVVVLLMTLLTVLVVEFFREAGLELRAAENFRDALQAHATARSGMATAAALLPGLSGQPKLAQSLLDGSFPIPSLPVPGGIVDVRLEDLDGMFPLGALVNTTGERVPKVVEAYRRLLKALPLEGVDVDQLVDALVAWVDAKGGGSYEHSDRFSVPNRPLESIEELSRVEGYAKIWRALLPHVDIRREKTVNVNTASKELLQCLHPEMDEGRAESLYSDLHDKPIEKNQIGTLGTRPGANEIKARGLWDLNPTAETTRVRVILTVTNERSLDSGRPSMAVLVKDGGAFKIAEWHEEWSYQPVQGLDSQASGIRKASP